MRWQRTEPRGAAAPERDRTHPRGQPADQAESGNNQEKGE
jgi:hypothetical protein